MEEKQIVKHFKNVIMPMKVPNNDYCSAYGLYCQHYHNDENGMPVCAVDFGPLNFNEDWQVEKPRDCRILKEK